MLLLILMTIMTTINIIVIIITIIFIIIIIIIIIINIAPVDIAQFFKILKKCQSKFDCLIFEMFFIKQLKPTLNKQCDSIRAKLFV